MDDERTVKTFVFEERFEDDRQRPVIAVSGDGEHTFIAMPETVSSRSLVNVEYARLLAAELLHLADIIETARGEGMDIMRQATD